jgi:uncharacterized membrane protein
VDYLAAAAAAAAAAVVVVVVVLYRRHHHGTMTKFLMLWMMKTSFSVFWLSSRVRYSRLRKSCFK